MRTSWIRRLRADRRGAAAVEFAMVVPLLLALIFSTLEAGWTMVQTIMLDRALDQTVRSLRVGNMANPSQAKIRQSICSLAYVLVDCENALAVELIPIVNEASYPTDSERCVNRGSSVQPALRFDAGGRTQTMFVRACFVVDPITPLLGLALALPRDATGAYRIVAKSGFVNEPV